MEIFRIENLSFAYPERDEKALDGVSFSVSEGEFVALCGPSGCGKSTLLRHLKTALAPRGTRSGEIFFEGRPLAEADPRAQSSKIGFVMQSPENQTVAGKVWRELASGLESLGYDAPTIRRRVAEMASFFGIEGWFYSDVAELSGGQRQLLSLASIMAMHPSALILDEPTSQLDPIAASEFLTALGRINRELGTTVIMTEHRLEAVLPLSGRMLVMERGRLIHDGTPEEVGERLRLGGGGLFLAMPTPMRLYAALKGEGPCPISVRDGRDWLTEYARTHSFAEKAARKNEAPAGGGAEIAVELDEVWFRYEKQGRDIIRGLSLKARRGEFLAILGGNGTGKTTALTLISGLNRPYRGRVRLFGKSPAEIPGLFEGVLGVLPQNPQALFAKDTVFEDLLEALPGTLGKAERERRAYAAAKLCDIERLLDRHPRDLSGGEQQRAALAKVLLLRPKILLLDEPTKGLDGEFKLVLAAIIKKLNAGGAAVIMVSHDIEFCASHAHRCALFFDGGLVAQGEPAGFFSGNSFYTTSANRMARHLLPAAVTEEDVIRAFGAEPKSSDRDVELDGGGEEGFAMAEAKAAEKKKAALPARRRFLGCVFGALVLG